MLKFVLRRAVLRIRLLGWCSRSVRDRRHIVQSWVVPMASWASAYAAPSKDELDALQAELLHLFDDRFGVDRAQVLVWEQLGWKFYPQMMLCRGAFRTLARLLSAPPNWVETVPLTEAFPLWNELLPEIPRWLQALKWTSEPEFGTVVRRDSSGRCRRRQLRHDSFRELDRWQGLVRWPGCGAPAIGVTSSALLALTCQPRLATVFTFSGDTASLRLRLVQSPTPCQFWFRRLVLALE